MTEKYCGCYCAFITPAGPVVELFVRWNPFQRKWGEVGGRCSGNQLHHSVIIPYSRLPGCGITSDLPAEIIWNRRSEVLATHTEMKDTCTVFIITKHPFR